jgi:hypothetical protein
MPKLPFRRRPYPVVNWCALRIGVACFYSQEKEKQKAAEPFYGPLFLSQGIGCTSADAERV